MINYQDPNSPTAQQTSQLSAGPGGTLQFQGLPGTSPIYTTTIFTIDAAFSESPTPEPSFRFLLGGAVLGLIAMRRKLMIFRAESGGFVRKQPQ